jgi:hypothetical protein
MLALRLFCARWNTEAKVVDETDHQSDAVKDVLKALEPLSPEDRVSVLDVVVQRLQIGLTIFAHAGKALAPIGREGLSIQNASSPHIETLIRRYGIIRFTF